MFTILMPSWESNIFSTARFTDKLLNWWNPVLNCSWERKVIVFTYWYLLLSLLHQQTTFGHIAYLFVHICNWRWPDRRTYNHYTLRYFRTNRKMGTVSQEIKHCIAIIWMFFGLFWIRKQRITWLSRNKKRLLLVSTFNIGQCNLGYVSTGYVNT